MMLSAAAVAEPAAGGVTTAAGPDSAAAMSSMNLAALSDTSSAPNHDDASRSCSPSPRPSLEELNVEAMAAVVGVGDVAFSSFPPFTDMSAAAATQSAAATAGIEAMAPGIHGAADTAALTAANIASSNSSIMFDLNTTISSNSMIPMREWDQFPGVDSPDGNVLDGEVPSLLNDNLGLYGVGHEENDMPVDELTLSLAPQWEESKVQSEQAISPF